MSAKASGWKSTRYVPEICSLKYGADGKAAVQQMPENILRRFKRLILPAGLDKKLLCQDLLHGIPCLRWDFSRWPSVSTQISTPAAHLH